MRRVREALERRGVSPEFVELEKTVRSATDAAFVRAKTGFVIGGVPPLGHVQEPVTFLDGDLLEQDEVWAAAGHTHVVFGLDSEDLLNVTDARVVRVA